MNNHQSYSLTRLHLQGMTLLSHPVILELLIYEPMITQDSFNGIKVCNDLEKFKESADLIISNRYSKSLNDVSYKVFTRDIFNSD